MATFGSNVRDLRERLGLSQTALASRLEVGSGQLSNWEHDRFGLPEGATLIKFAKALRCRVEDLLAHIDEEYMTIAHAPGPEPVEIDGRVDDDDVRSSTSHDQGGAALLKKWRRLDPENRVHLEAMLDHTLTAQDQQRRTSGVKDESTSKAS